MAILECSTKVNDLGQELVTHGTEEFPVACYHDDLSQEEVAWHWHDELELILVSEGVALVAVGQEKYEITEGNGIFINSGILHAARMYGEDGCRLRSLVFHPRLVGGGEGSVFWKKYLSPLIGDISLGKICFNETVGWHREVLEQLELAWHGAVEEDQGYEFDVREALSRIIRLLVLRRPMDGKALSGKERRDEERMKRMLQYIRDHFEEEITVKQIADSALISASECLRCFQGTIGMPPIQYVLQCRIQQAAEWLLSTDHKIVDIGMQCGFQDMSYFARTFRKFKGCTPSAYRKQKKNILYG